jgi:Uma2 family endonuclease
MSSQSKTFITPEEYLEIERKAEFRSEYYAGDMFALAGASKQPNLIAGNIFAAFHGQFIDRSCNVYQSDMRVKISKTGLYTYPDVVAVCGEELFDDNHRDLLLNPVVIVEVLSESTEAYDRGKSLSIISRSNLSPNTCSSRKNLTESSVMCGKRRTVALFRRA